MTPAQPSWRQLNLKFDDRQTAERAAVHRLGPALRHAEATGLISSWFFIRKPWWRIRYCPASPRTTTNAIKALNATAQALVNDGQAQQWRTGIYEPETHAFGGPEAMTAAHTLFHCDSYQILTHLAREDTSGSAGLGQRRELSMLLCTSLMRAAGQDRYEQGDIWAKVSDLRPTDIAPPDAQWDAFVSAIHRLISVDTGPHTALRINSLAFAEDWLTGFEKAGQALRALSEEGCLTRGIRAVCTHHIIFHWNRLGLTRHIQANMARAAKEAIFT